VSVKDFGAVGDGVTNDTVALTNFWNSAIANPGVPHVLEAKTYAISSPMPVINVSNVKIYGQGADIHDTGSLVTGTVLKWIGVSSPSSVMVKLTAVAGASNQKVGKIAFVGVGLDCNFGGIGYGFEALSIVESEISVAICNASAVAAQFGVVSPLGEASDFQNNVVRLQIREIETSGLGVVCGGNSVANVSLNEFWVDIQHANASGIHCVNADNNDWRYVRVFRAAGGTATESVTLLGGPTDAERCRAERFHYLTSTVALRAYGTGSYTFGSTNHKIYCLDTENGTPAPVVDAGASVYWRKDTTALEDTAWISYTPVLSTTVGSLTTSSATGRYAKRGKVIHFTVQIVITTNGTGAGVLQATLPFVSAGAAAFTGVERGVTGKQINAFVDGNSSTLTMRFYDAVYPGANGAIINISGTYQVA